MVVPEQVDSSTIESVQGFYKLESQGNSYQIQAKSGKSGKVRETQGYLKISE